MFDKLPESEEIEEVFQSIIDVFSPRAASVCHNGFFFACFATPIQFTWPIPHLFISAIMSGHAGPGFWLNCHVEIGLPGDPHARTRQPAADLALRHEKFLCGRTRAQASLASHRSAA